MHEYILSLPNTIQNFISIYRGGRTMQEHLSGKGSLQGCRFYLIINAYRTVANSVVLDHTLQNARSDQGLHSFR